MNFNFIILLLIFRKFNFYSEYHEYRDGVETTFRVTKTSADYTFCIWTNNAKSVIFNAKTTNGCQFNLIDIYNYDDPKYRGSYKRISPDSINTNNICEYYYIYTFSYAKYVDFTTTITDYSNNKTNITIRMDLIHGEYDLYNGEPFERFNLYSSNSYFLYLKYFEAAALIL